VSVDGGTSESSQSGWVYPEGAQEKECEKGTSCGLDQTATINREPKTSRGAGVLAKILSLLARAREGKMRESDNAITRPHAKKQEQKGVKKGTGAPVCHLRGLQSAGRHVRLAEGPARKFESLRDLRKRVKKGAGKNRRKNERDERGRL